MVEKALWSSQQWKFMSEAPHYLVVWTREQSTNWDSPAWLETYFGQVGLAS